MTSAVLKPLKPAPSVCVSPIAQLAALYKALAEGVRLQILRLLKNDSFGVLELCHILDIRQSALSHHLKILATARLVSTRREGNSIFYRRAFLPDDDSHRDIKTRVFDQLDDIDLPATQENKIRQIQLERSQLSLSFFNKNAARFKEKQGLIVEHDDYHGTLLGVIEGMGLDSDAAVMEIGPGEGQLLVKLAERFQHLIAVDNSNDMLERSRQTITDNGFDSVAFLLGDTTVVLKKNLANDLIILDMVLHHISSPAKTLSDCAALLNPGGNLLIAELASHDQDWVRETCGDLWLGFEASDLDLWAEKVGLLTGQSSYLTLRNGFQIQIRVFQKERHGN